MSDDTEQICVRFDTRWRAATPAMRKSVDYLQSAIEGTEQRARKRRVDDAERFALAIEVLLCNLVALSMAAPGARLQVLLSDAQAAKSKALGRGHSRAVVAMEQLGLLELRRNEHSRLGEIIRTLSSVLPTTALKPFLHGLSIADIRVNRSTSSPLLLRDFKDDQGNAELLKWAHTDETRQMAERMREVNDFLYSLDVTYTGQQAWLAKTNKPSAWLRSIVTPKHMRSVRIFNNRSFACNGRLHGGFWVNLTKEQRVQHIKLQGETVAHCDYTAAYLNLAYHHHSIAYPFADDENGYVAADYGDDKAWKLITAALLAAKTMPREFPFKTHTERAAMQRRFHDVPAREVYDAVRARHHALTAAGAFGCGLSNQLAKLESDLMIELLLRLKAADVHALPVHDCCICPESEATRVASIMESTACAVRLQLPAGIETAKQ